MPRRGRGARARGARVFGAAGARRRATTSRRRRRIGRACRRRRRCRRPAGSRSRRGLQHEPRRRRRPPRQRAGHAQARLHARLGRTRRHRRLGAARDESGARRAATATRRSSSSGASRSTTTSAFGLEGGGTLPSSRHGLGIGSGKPDWALNAIYSADFGAWHTDLNLRRRRDSARSTPARSHAVARRGFAVALARRAVEHWSASLGDASARRRRDAPAALAASYNVSKRLVLDAGAARSLRGGAPVWSAFTGFTWLAARIF